jgi:hypothetical protein
MKCGRRSDVILSDIYLFQGSTVLFNLGSMGSTTLGVLNVKLCRRWTSYDHTVDVSWKEG